LNHAKIYCLRDHEEAAGVREAEKKGNVNVIRPLLNGRQKEDEIQ
jgi:hypothetical protein